jgi:EAL domain-containing protein (putative c-di-GMP-specific phosphodiesterase class I)
VLETACRQSRAWQAAGLPPVRVAANLSAAQFLRRDLVASVLRALDVTGLAPEHLELEITEGLLMRDTTGTTATLRRLADLGIRIALDDFGTGYSSMSYLKRFPVHKIKIDRAFVTGIADDRGDAAIVRAVTCLAHDLDLTVSAEGVETPEQVARLRALGCDELQGYYFGRPMPASDFAARIHELTASRDESWPPAHASPTIAPPRPGTVASTISRPPSDPVARQRAP